jgi:hypothetical protein
MKNKEIDVWIMDNFSEQLKDEGDLLMKDQKQGYFTTKAKLIIPVEPEVVEFESMLKMHPQIDESSPARVLLAMYPDTTTIHRMAGRRWKCKFEEVIE